MSMTLLALRNEVLNHGFDAGSYSGRVNQWLNDAYGMVCRRVNFYAEETTNPISTVSGTATYAWPADFGRMRSLYDTVNRREIQPVSLRQIDQASVSQGIPIAYAQDAMFLHLYPTPDQAYSLVLRYWKTPSPLVADTDTPSLPGDWHRVLWYWATKEAYAADDDVQTAQYWEQQFNTALAELEADVRFPDENYPVQAASMWGDDQPLSRGGWSMYLP